MFLDGMEWTNGRDVKLVNRYQDIVCLRLSSVCTCLYAVPVG